MMRNLKRFMRKLGLGRLKGGALGSDNRSQYPYDWAGGWLIFLVGAAVVYFAVTEAFDKETARYEDGERVRPSRLDHDPYYEKVLDLVEGGLIDLNELAKTARNPIEKPTEEFDSLIAYGVDESQLEVGRNRLFYKRSPLRSDIIKLLQGAEQSTFGWNVRRDRLHIDRNRRKIGTPFYRGHSWNGKLLFRTDRAVREKKDEPELSSQYELRIRYDGEEQMSHKLMLTDKYPDAESWGYAEFGDPFPNKNPFKGFRFNGRPRQPGDTPPNILEVFLTKSEEDQLLINLMIPGGTSHFSISKGRGWTQTEGPAGTTIHTSPISYTKNPKVRFRKDANPGEDPRPLSFRVLTSEQSRENPYYWDSTATAQEAFSFSHYHDGVARRVRISNDLPHSLEFLKSLDDSIAQIYLDRERNGDPISNQLKKQDFNLTIDPTIQSQVQSVVNAAKGGQHLEVAVTVMNEFGEVLAVADSVFPGTGGADFLATRPRYRLNRNFWEHPVGSSGKPYLYSAGIHANPSLREFVVPRASQYTGTILSYKLPKSIPSLHTSGGFPSGSSKRTDFAYQADEAFARSSNVFFMSHLLASLASKGEGDLPVNTARYASYQVGDQLLYHAPDLSRFLKTNKNTLSGMVNSPFVQALNDVLGVKVGLGDGPFSHANVDEGYGDLLKFFEQMGLEKNDLVPFLAGSAPEHSRLIFADNMRVGHDLLYIVIGGANFGRWSNVDIARSMTRLVTGNAVQTTLVRIPENGTMPPPIEWPPTVLSDENKQWMRDRLQAPGRGTAGHLKRNVPAGYRLYAKTGTFKINVPTARRGNYSMITFYLEPELTPEGEPNTDGQGGLCAVVSINSPSSIPNSGLWKRVIDRGLVNTMVRYMQDK